MPKPAQYTGACSFCGEHFGPLSDVLLKQAFQHHCRWNAPRKHEQAKAHITHPTLVRAAEPEMVEEPR